MPFMDQRDLRKGRIHSARPSISDKDEVDGQRNRTDHGADMTAERDHGSHKLKMLRCELRGSHL
jgi:hypothetical protein